MPDLEQGLLSTLTTPENIRFVWDRGLRDDVFVDPINQNHYNFVIAYWHESGMANAPTPFVISEHFEKFTFTEPEETLTWMVERIKERFTRNQLEDTLKDTAAILGADEPQQAAQELLNRTWSLVQSTTPRRSRQNMSEDVAHRRERYAERANRPEGVVIGAPLGYDEIDQFTNGLLPGELAAMVGPPKAGKSHTLARACVAQRRAGYTPYVATLELDTDVFEDRIDAWASGVSYTRLDRGQLDQEEVVRLREAQDEMADLGSIFVERPERGARTAQAIVNRARQLGADVILLDQLSWMEATSKHTEIKDRVAEMVVDLRETISEPQHPIACYMAAQFNREGKKEQTMQNIGLSSFVEQTVDIAWGMKQSDEMRNNRVLEYIIMGSRRTDLAGWLVEWRFDTATRSRVLDHENGVI